MLKGIRLLAAEDEQMSREMLADILTSQGVDCTSVTNGREALDVLEASPDMDILLLDLQMPVMDGFEVLRQCKGNPYLCDIPVIVLAGDHNEKLRSLQLGADDFLAKPYDLEELELRIAKLVRTRRISQSAKTAKKEFLTIASHELRNPIHQINGLCELLEDDGSVEVQREYISLLKSSTINLTELVTAILCYVELDHAAAADTLEPFSLRATVQSVIDNFHELSSSKQLTVRTAIGAEVADALNGPGFYITRLFSILIKNALMFSTSGEVVVSIHEESFGRYGSRFCCSVTDQGSGIPEELREAIFEPFAQVDASNTRHHEGIGLGLAIARRITELLGGSIALVQSDSSGSRFDFSFMCDVRS